MSNHMGGRGIESFDGSKHPFRPLSRDVVNPYTFLEGQRERELTEPLIGLDGGFLVPASVLTAEKGTAIGNFLSLRTVPTGERYAVTHETTTSGASVRFHSAPLGTWHTSRGSRYYEANHGFNTGGKDERMRVLTTNLQMDAALITQWDAVLERLSQYDNETRFRLLAAMQQNMANDLIGLDYATRVASLQDKSAKTLSGDVSSEVFDAVTAYYKTLLDPEDPQTDPQKFEIVKHATNILTQVNQLSNPIFDNVRNHREADATYQTLAGAATFIHEFGKRIKGKPDDPLVVIPLLGAYDLGPALRALGYRGDIKLMVPALKTHSMYVQDNEIPRRERFFVDASAQFEPEDLYYMQGNSDTIHPRPVVIFEDTRGQGRTLMLLAAEFDRMGVPVEAMRTLFVNNRWHPEGTASTMRVPKHKGYFELPAIGMSKVRGVHQNILFARKTSKQWEREREKTNQ